MNPPLRSARRLAALLAGLADGTVDAIATDHAPHHADEKALEFELAPFGIVGLETTLALCLDRLVRAGRIPLARLVELLSTGPARVLGLPGGTLAPGAPGDVTVLDLEREVDVVAAALPQQVAQHPVRRLEAPRAAVATVVGGRVVHRVA